MCIKSCLIVNSILILNTQINANADINNHSEPFASQSMSHFYTNGLIQMPPVYFDENKRAIYRDFKNHNDRKTSHRVSNIKPLNEPRILPKIPSLYLEPPTNVKHHWNNNKLKKKTLKTKSKNSTATKIRDEVTRPSYIRDHDPLVQQKHQETEETTNAEMKKQEGINEKNLKKKNRIDFHVHGHQGPDSYIFGFDTGHGKNRQFRLEEKHKNGTVTGHYGYYDARGELRKICYKSEPTIEYEKSTNAHSLGE